ncbi:MAG: sulfatase-like hydrolase/transferase [Anaerolineaceae bacterium]|nr:sulfatase-like hydrolase/transferase [Anaerolineaceae bacterium]
MKPANLLFILSDQHNVNVLGSSGNSAARTPNLDGLAARGTRFANAYTNCPICVPARASLATGQYVHRIRHWDNAFPWNGTPRGWGHQLKEQGYNVTSIGKLHFRSADDDNGFTEEIDPLHVVEGLGDLLSCVRDDPPRRDSRACITEAGPGDSTYLQYDASNTAHALEWLKQHANDDKPWVLFLSLVCPHPPFIAPPEFYARQDPLSLPLPPQWQEADWPRHPVLDNMRRFFNLEPAFDEETLRKLLATYYAVCEYVDDNVGKVIAALDELGLNESTRVVYSTDHGESLGARGLFGKFTMYEEAAAVPLIMAGPEVPAGHVVQTPVSLLDMAPTILEGVDARPDDWSAQLPGQSLWSLMQEADQDRSVFSEYHTVGTRHGYFMLRDLRYKYVHYVDGPPQLFDLIDDPWEVRDLAGIPDFGPVLKERESRLRSMLDPEAVDAQARADQRAKVEDFGGEAAVRARGTFANSPVPGEEPGFRRYDSG